MNKQLITGLSLIFLCITATAQTKNTIHFSSEPDTVNVTTNQHGLLKKKRISFMHVEATPEQQKIFMRYKPDMRPTIKLASTLPSAASSSMSNVPVLNQGQYGTCVTFANTAAIDALLNIGDGISQLCNLALGSNFDHTMGGYGYTPSGWNGNYGEYVLEQITRFGILTKMTQMEYSCGGATEYPLNTSAIPSMPMSAQQFYSLHSINVMANLDWTVLLNYIQRFTSDPAAPYNGANTLLQVKQVIASANPSLGKAALATVGFQLYTDICGGFGACAQYSPSSSGPDTWVLTQSINERTDFPTAGHEIIVVGYDDNAKVIDNEGVTHTGLLTLRNSWGANMGNQGNFYMTYDYFMKFATEAQEIRTLPYQG